MVGSGVGLGVVVLFGGLGAGVTWNWKESINLIFNFHSAQDLNQSNPNEHTNKYVKCLLIALLIVSTYCNWCSGKNDGEGESGDNDASCQEPGKLAARVRPDVRNALSISFTGYFVTVLTLKNPLRVSWRWEWELEITGRRWLLWRGSCSQKWYIVNIFGHDDWKHRFYND